ncbi:MAG: amidohydrolase family protein [Alphaproteobacteria bacterium]|nr:amidohydrolase family protein [Alphaproteobacteria bacterium]
MRKDNKRPGFAMPAGATDSHMHVFGPFDLFPLAAKRSYTPAPALTADYRALQRQIGLSRVVFVQPSAYGTDNRCTLDAMAAIGPAARGVVVIEDSLGEAELAAMHKAGVRGVRINILSVGASSAEALTARLRATAARLAPFGWHIQLFASIGLIAAVMPIALGLPVPVVVDHMGMPDGQGPADQPGFGVLLEALGSGRIWVKLSGSCRVDTGPPPHQRALPFARALAAARPDRMVWGSDWPHIGVHGGKAVGGEAPPVPYRDLDNGALLDELATWVPEAARRNLILVDNPARLYGF